MRSVNSVRRRKKVAHPILATALVIVTVLIVWGFASNWWQPAGRTLTKDGFVAMGYSKEYWPWTSDETDVLCKDHGAVVIRVDGKSYPLNEAAKNNGYAFGDLDTIWRNDSDGIQIDAGDYNHVALGYCGIDSPALHDPDSN